MNIIENLIMMLKEKKLNAYLVSPYDYNINKAETEYFKSIEYLTGATKVEETMLVTQEKAYIWVNEKHYQATIKEIDASSVVLYKIDKSNPTIKDILKTYLKNGDVIGYDAKSFSITYMINFMSEFENIRFQNIDLINDIWYSRPKQPFSLIYKLDDFYTGRTFKEKLELIRENAKHNEAEFGIISSLENQAWLFNLRASDIPYNPVFYAFTIIGLNFVILFVDTKKLSTDVVKYLEANEVTIREYNSIYEYLKSIKARKIILNKHITNYEIYSILKESNTIIDRSYKIANIKNKKTPNEIKNIKIAEHRDSVCITKLMYYLKTNPKVEYLTETSVVEYLNIIKEKTNGYIGPAFEPICAFKEHSAIYDYKPQKNAKISITKDGILLIDTGSHYLEGSTDIARSFSLGKVSDKVKEAYTIVLKGLIRLSDAVFLKGCTGKNLDILAREAIWKNYKNYPYSTGHGINYLLKVRDESIRIKWDTESCVLEDGMLLAIEPGLYMEGEFGIRIENELLCINKATNDLGEFLGFETLTLVPFDIDCIKLSLLTKPEKEWINNYHNLVYEKLSPKLNKAEAEWLKEATKKI